VAELRVLQVGKFYPPDEGGMESHLEGLCRHLSPHARLEVLVASRSRQTTHETIDGVSVTRVGTVATIRSAPVCPELRWRIRQSDADVIHLHHPNPSAFLSYLVSGHRGRLIVTYHSDVVQQRLLNAVYEPIVRAVLARADAIIVSSQEYMDTSPMLERYRVRDGRSRGRLGDPARPWRPSGARRRAARVLQGAGIPRACNGRRARARAGHRAGADARIARG